MKDKKLIQLQKEWYQRLKDDGFEDTEYFDKSMEPRDIQKQDTYKKSKEIKDRYYTMNRHYTYARQLVHTDLIDDKQRQVLKYYCEGVPYRKIAAHLGTNFSAVKKIMDSITPILKEYSARADEYRMENCLD